MADRTFAADTRPVVDDVEVLAGVVHRLQARLDRQLWLLDRMQGDPLQPEPAQLPELIEIARRIRSDSERLLLLGGRDPGVRDDAPQGLRTLLDAAAAAASEPRRVEVRPAPFAAVAAGAATELRHVLAELLDHTTAVYPAGRVRVGSHIDSSGAVTVEVRAEGATCPDTDGLHGQRALDTAERLADRSRYGIALRRQHGDGDVVASVTCPRAAVVAEEPADPPQHSRSGGSNGHSAPSGGAAALSTAATPESGFDPPGLPELEPAFAAAPERASSDSATETRTRSTDGTLLAAEPGAQVDALFGPIADLPLDPDTEGASTPIFEAIASAWFRGDETGDKGGDPGTLSWETPGDREWRAAAEQANRAEPTTVTAQGLPMRRPGNQLVPPPPAGDDATSQKPAGKAAPEHVRDRIGGYQRGVQRGRHRADPGSGTDPGDPEFW
ncbi:MAG: hypothetical protein L0H84_03795 [Pseudonocardia sp.]|nr:hypothetical protein [Pseudonocardia sp.]